MNQKKQRKVDVVKPVAELLPLPLMKDETSEQKRWRLGFPTQIRRLS